MLRVTVELVPFGYEDMKKPIAEMTIYNDATSPTPHSKGNYVAMTHDMEDKSVKRSTTTQDYSRVENRVFKDVWYLVRDALEGMDYA